MKHPYKYAINNFDGTLSVLYRFAENKMLSQFASFEHNELLAVAITNAF